MKTTKTMTAIIAFATLTAAGAASAGGHDAYHRAFFADGGSSLNAVLGQTGKAAYGQASGSAWDGHEAYQRAFPGEGGYNHNTSQAMGKAAFGSSSGADGNAIYRGAFHGD